FDLALDLVEFQGELRASYEYATDLFDEISIARMHECFVTLLEGIVADPSRRLDELPLLPPADAGQLLGAWNDTALEHDRSRCVHQFLEESARRSPDAPAVLSGGETVTYGELDARANRLARLLAARGVSAGDLVAVC